METYYKNYYQILCIATIWIMILYSGVIQQRFFVIPNGMLIFGSIMVFLFLVSISNRPISVKMLVPREARITMLYLFYMLIVGSIVSPSFLYNFNQAVTSIEYAIVMLIMIAITRETKTETFWLLLLVQALIYAAIMIIAPIETAGAGRFSIAYDTNPNSVGIVLSAGAWSGIHFYQRKKITVLPLLVLFCVFGYSIIMTGSRKAIIAFMILVILWAILCYLPELKKRGLLSRACSVVFIIVAGWGISRFLFKEYNTSVLAQRMLGLVKEMQEGDRHTMYVRGWELIKQHPIFGIGFQGYTYYYGTYSHSTFIEVPLCGGIVGSILYFSTYISSILKCLHLCNGKIRNKNCLAIREKAKVVMIMWVAVLFYCVCVIHPYDLTSFMVFAVIFAETANLQDQLQQFCYSAKGNESSEKLNSDEVQDGFLIIE